MPSQNFPQKNTTQKTPQNSTLKPEADKLKPNNFTQTQPQNEKLAAKKIPLWKNKKFLLFTLLPLVLIIASVSAFTFRNSLLTATLEGFVLDNNGSPISGAKLVVNNKEATTDQAGYYKFNSLPHTGKISLSSDRFVSKTEKINLTPFRLNRLDFGLEFLKFSKFTGKLENLEDVDTNDLELKIDDQKLELNGLEFSSPDLAPGKHRFTLESSKYQDFETIVDLLPGGNDFGALTLTPAKNLQVSLTNWASGESIKNAELALEDEKFTTDDKGIVEFEDGADFIGKKIKVELENYLPLETTVEELAETLELVPTGKIVYSSNRQGANNLFSSNIDGSQEQKLTNDKGNYFAAQIIDGKVVFESDRESVATNFGLAPQLFEVNLDGGEIKKISNSSGNRYLSEETYFLNFSLPAKKIVQRKVLNRPFAEFQSEIKLLNLDETNPVVIYSKTSVGETKEEIGDYLVSPAADKVTFVTKIEPRNYNDESLVTQKIIQVDLKTKQQIELFKEEGNYTSISGVDLLSYSPNGKLVVANIQKSGVNTGWIYNFNNSKTETIPAGVIAKFEFTANSEKAYFLASEDGKFVLYQTDLITGSSQIINNSGFQGFHLEPENEVLILKQDNKIKVLRAKDKLEDFPIGTDFGIWNFEFNNF